MNTLLDNLQQLGPGIAQAYIMIICDCISVGEQGAPTVRTMFKQFPYANVYQNRLKSKLPSPGTIELLGRGTLEEPYIIIAYGQIYPTNASFPNDNPRRRKEWLTQICAMLTRINSLSYLYLPPDLQPYQRQCFSDFAKKYYLATKQRVTIYDYQGQLLSTDHKSPLSQSAQPKLKISALPPLDQYRVEDIVFLQDLAWNN